MRALAFTGVLYPSTLAWNMEALAFTLHQNEERRGDMRQHEDMRIA